MDIQDFTAKSVIKISVTAEDIKLGTRKDGFYCPVALAIRRTFNITNLYDVRVNRYHVVIINTYRFFLPNKVDRFIDLFDRGSENLNPFEFELHGINDVADFDTNNKNKY